MSTTGSPLEALKGGFRRACVKRLVGDENGAIEVLKNEIPLLVVAWAKNSSLEPSEKKAKLKEMFDDESFRADELALAFELFAGRFEARVASRVQESVKGMVYKMEKLADRFAESLSYLSNNHPVVESSDAHSGELEDPLKIEEVDVKEAEPEIDGLDPPLGIGLKFDEIEEMIDELLTSEDN